MAIFCNIDEELFSSSLYGMEAYYVSYSEPVFVGIDNSAYDEKYSISYEDTDTVKFYFSKKITDTLYIWASVRVSGLTFLFSNVIEITGLGTMPELVYDNTTFCGGSTLAVSASPNNLGDGNYKWYRNNNLIPSENNSGYDIGEAGEYKVSVIDASSVCPTNEVTSESVEFKILQPTIAGELKPDLNRLSLTTSGSYESYQWYEGSDKNSITEVTGATNSSYNVSLGDADKYVMLSVLTTNSCTAYSDTFLVNNTTYSAPEIVAPEILTVCPDETVELSVADIFHTYQWFKNGEVVLNANLSTLTITEEYPYGEGDYSVEVTPILDTDYKLSSTSVSISVQDRPALSIVDDAAYCLDAEVTFSTPNNFDSYKWLLNDANNVQEAVEVSGFTDTTMTFTVKESTRYYWVEVTNSVCANSFHSNPRIVSPYLYNDDLTIRTEDFSDMQEFCYGDSVKLSSTISEGLLDWYFNGYIIQSSEEKDLYAKEYGNYTVSATSLKCDNVEPIISNDTISVVSRVKVNYSVTPDGEDYYYNNDPEHKIYCNGEPLVLDLDNAKNYNKWQWMGKLFSESSTSDEWEDLEGVNDSIFAFDAGSVGKLRFKVRVDSIMGDGSTCVGISNPKIIDTWVFTNPEFYAPESTTGLICDPNDSIMLKSAFGTGENSIWSKYEWKVNGEVIPDSDREIIYAKEEGYYQLIGYFHKCPDNPNGIGASGPMYIGMMEEAIIFEEDEKLVGTPYFYNYYQWFYSAEDPTINSDNYFLDNMTAVNSDTLLYEYEIPFDQAPNGFYAFQVESSDSCLKTSEVYRHNLTSININEENSIHIYPNPVLDELHLNIANPNSIMSIELFTISGTKVRSISSVSNQNTISVDNLKSGVYFVKVNSYNSSPSVKKIIVK